jgi:hypothetical protein
MKNPPLKLPNTFKKFSKNPQKPLIKLRTKLQKTVKNSVNIKKSKKIYKNPLKT